MDEVAVGIGNIISRLSTRHNIPDDTNLNGTGSRVSRMYDELLSGYTQSAKEILKADFPSEDYDQMIVVQGIDFFSLCAHHMVPFYGKIAVGYLPSTGGKVVGLSKIVRVCHMFARRFQIQERMTQQIAETLEKYLRPRGVGVLVYDVKHLCMLMRGVKQHTSTVDTSSVLGEFRDDPAVRAEFLSLISR